MKTFSINELLNRYFGTDTIDLGENKPKLSKQLKKLNITVSDLEIKFWGEAVTELIGLYTDADYFNTYEGNPYDYEFGVKFSAELPTYDEQDEWAFDGSCNNTDGCGNITSTTMATYEGSRYCYIYNTDGEPTGRFYYFSQVKGFCVADWYRVSNHGEYSAPLALCGSPVHLSRNYIEANGCDHFCDRDCLEDYFDIVE